MQLLNKKQAKAASAAAKAGGNRFGMAIANFGIAIAKMSARKACNQARRQAICRR